MASEFTPMRCLTDGKPLAYSVPCCDNCMRTANPAREFTHITEFLKFMLPALTIDEAVPQNATADSVDPGTKAAEGMGPRRTERRAACRDFLTEWRVERWLENHADEVWGPEILLPDKVLTKLAATASLQTKEDIRNEVEGWWLWDRYSQEVLDGLKAIDLRFEAIKAAKEADRLEEQQIERDRRMAIAHAEKQRMLEEKERKRLLKEAAAQEERRRKEEAKEQKEKLKREKEEAKQQKRAAREEAKRQREEAKRQKEEAKRQREEAKRQREEVATEAGRQSGEREEKRRRTTHAAFVPIPPLPSNQLPVAPIPSTKPRPRPTKRPPPTLNTENLDPRLQFGPPHPAPHLLPMFAGYYPYEINPQSTPPSYGDLPFSAPSLQAPANAYPSPVTMPSPHHPLYPSLYPISSGLGAGGTECAGPYTTADS